jgi:hypothetical protein
MARRPSRASAGLRGRLWACLQGLPDGGAAHARPQLHSPSHLSPRPTSRPSASPPEPSLDSVRQDVRDYLNRTTLEQLQAAGLVPGGGSSSSGVGEGSNGGEGSSGGGGEEGRELGLAGSGASRSGNGSSADGASARAGSSAGGGGGGAATGSDGGGGGGGNGGPPRAEGLDAGTAEELREAALEQQELEQAVAATKAPVAAVVDAFTAAVKVVAGATDVEEAGGGLGNKPGTWAGAGRGRAPRGGRAPAKALSPGARTAAHQSSI